MPQKRKNLQGKRFGRLLVIERAPDYVSPSGHRLSRWLCLCDCGETRQVTQSDLKRTGGKATVSCGCYWQDTKHTRNATHGLSKHPLYQTWKDMMRRCYSPDCGSYPHYGGRGITVCKPWHDPARFITDIETFIGPRPEGMDLDRPLNDCGYHPINVRWATRRQNVNNRSITRFATLSGTTLPLSVWADKTGISHSTLATRIRELGWSDERALTTPADERYWHDKQHTEG